MESSIQRERRIVAAASKVTDPAERAAFLERACDGDAVLRAKVEASLAVGGHGRSFARSIDAPILDGQTTSLGTTLEELELELVGTSVGPYRLIERLGEGGCGVVYLADQEKPVRRRVALKVIKLGMDTKSVLARFEAEQQALALMEHPNIARVLDAGVTESGRPFFAMELVQGLKLTTYSDAHKLDIQQRLVLFAQVCHAIQHAHQKGIIHRDIKPSNIIVAQHGGVAVPKVIDFGVAKAVEGRLSDMTYFTPQEHFLGTPAFMSPEQSEFGSKDVDTRTDIYSLGVLLYELLTGKTPFDQRELVAAGLSEMRRILRDREPPTPSKRVAGLNAEELAKVAENRSLEPAKLQSRLSGDLDWIVVKALEKDRERRYQTANGLAADVRRHLANEPVVASPPSRLYRLQKLARRNRATFATGIFLAISLLGLSLVSSLFLIKEREARKRAVAAEQQALAAEKEQRSLRVEAEDRERIAQAAFLIGQDQIEQADDLVGQVSSVRPSLEAESVFRTLGEWHALKGQWSQSAERFRLLLEADQKDNSWAITEDLLKAGPILIERGDLKGYERFRRAAIARYAETTDPVFAERTLKISLLVPGDRQLMQTSEPLSAIAADSMERTGWDPIMEAWRCISLALDSYRRDDMSGARAWCQKSLSYSEDNPARIATAHVIQAMACYRLGELEAARSELALGRKLIRAEFDEGLDPGNGSVGFWFDWLFARILLREAEALVQPK